MTTKTGHCLCGAVSFSAEDVSGHHHACHCGICRRWSGGPGFAVPVGKVEWQGEEHIGRYASSDWGERGFCKQCGSGLFFRFVSKDEYYINAGAFADDSDFQLVGEIYVDEQPPGYRFSDGLQRMTGDEFLAMLGESAD
ncbi:MAG: GFA family protein [Gammaproteobacteria bacterium]|nr:GFA family protein [Gammaproteobacteria bacterium]